MTNGTGNESYTFDGVGNRTASHLSATYGYQAYNRMTSTASATMTYNANANLTQKIEGGTTWTYAWDYENRMTSAANGTATAQYRYDPLGRRIRRIVAATGEDTKFIYDGLDVIMDDDTTTGVTKYQNGPGIDDKLKLTNGGVSKYFIADHLGSTVALTDATGAVAEQNSYDSFGNQSNPGFSSRYQYSGREYDPLSGFYFYRARWYDANVGRFVSEDPIGLAGGDINIYAYVKNNSAAFRDPTGLSRCNPILGAILGGVVGGAAGAGVGALVGATAGAVAGAVVGTFALPGGGTIGGGALGGGGGANAGAVVGGAIGAGIGGYAGYQYCSQPEATTSCQPTPRVQPQPSPTPAPLPVPMPSQPTRSSCPPCQTVSGTIVPVGTTGYRPLDPVPGHGVPGPHHNLFVCNQAPINSPVPCKCFWQKIHAVPPPPPAGSIPIEPFL